VIVGTVVVVMMTSVIVRTAAVVMVITSVIMGTLFNNILHDRICLDGIIIVGKDLGSFTRLLHWRWTNWLAVFCVMSATLGLYRRSTNRFRLTATIPHFVTIFNVYIKSCRIWFELSLFSINQTMCVDPDCGCIRFETCGLYHDAFF
jgi:hypothetical protein